MAWQTIDRTKAPDDLAGPAVLSEGVRDKIRSFFPRYETRRAALLPALHIVQDALGQITPKAMVEVAELLGIHPSDVLDTVSFYTHFWTKPRGKKMVTVCRSISCELMGGNAVLEAVKKHLGIDAHETTPDGRFSLATEECLAGCDHAPCLLINERLHRRVSPTDVPRILDDPENDQHGLPRSTLYDAAPNGAGAQDEDLETGADPVKTEEAD